MPAIIVKVRETPDDKKTGMVDLHVFHPNSSGTNIVYGVKFSEKESESTWWWPPSKEELIDRNKKVSEAKTPHELAQTSKKENKK
jgi:hypothetical protein